MFKVFFHYLDRKPRFLSKIKTRLFVETIFKKEKTTLERIDYIFCSDEYLLEINKKFLNHPFFTDIITFNLSDPKNQVKGEIYISVDRVKENSSVFKTKREEEFLRVVIHGALHLCGYKDKIKKDVELMRVKEIKYLKLFTESKNQ